LRNHIHLLPNNSESRCGYPSKKDVHHEIDEYAYLHQGEAPEIPIHHSMADHTLPKKLQSKKYDLMFPPFLI